MDLQFTIQGKMMLIEELIKNEDFEFLYLRIKEMLLRLQDKKNQWYLAQIVTPLQHFCGSIQFKFVGICIRSEKALGPVQEFGMYFMIVCIIF